MPRKRTKISVVKPALVLTGQAVFLAAALGGSIPQTLLDTLPSDDTKDKSPNEDITAKSTNESTAMEEQKSITEPDHTTVQEKCSTGSDVVEETKLNSSGLKEALSIAADGMSLISGTLAVELALKELKSKKKTHSKSSQRKRKK